MIIQCSFTNCGFGIFATHLTLKYMLWLQRSSVGRFIPTSPAVGAAQTAFLRWNVRAKCGCKMRIAANCHRRLEIFYRRRCSNGVLLAFLRIDLAARAY